MSDSQFFTRTAAALEGMPSSIAHIDKVLRALLSTIDGHRSVIELESVARAMRLEPEALSRLRAQGLIQLTTAD